MVVVMVLAAGAMGAAFGWDSGRVERQGLERLLVQREMAQGRALQRAVAEMSKKRKLLVAKAEAANEYKELVQELAKVNVDLRACDSRFTATVVALREQLALCESTSQ